MNFDILDQSGNKIKCDVVSLFRENDINYIVYTDGTKNNFGKLEVYAARYIKEDNVLKLLDIEDDSEWDLIDEYLAKLNKR